MKVDYYQIHGVYQVDKLVKENPTAFRCLSWIASGCCDMDGVYLSHSALAEKMGYCTKTVQRALKYLRDNDYIQTIKMDRSSQIYLNPLVVWRGDGKDRMLEIKAKMEID